MNVQNVNPKQAETGAVPSGNLLAARAMLASLNIQAWSARKHDRKVTDKATAAHNASADAGRFNKLLISKAALARVENVAGRARREHEARTLPWSAKGAAILSAAGFLEYSKTMQALRLEFEAEVAKFVAAYPAERDARKAELGDMFDPTDYPSPDEIAARFSFRVRLDPMPDARDFRVEIGEAQAAAIRAEIEERSREALAEATREPWKRIALAVGNMAEKLSAYKPAAGPGDRAENVFRDSLVENVRKLVDLLPGLNVTGDAELAALAARMAADLCRHDAETLRESDTLRASVADKAEKILADVSAYLA